MRAGLIEYSVRTIRTCTVALGGVCYDMLPCEVEINAKFIQDKDAREFERKVREMLEPPE